MFFPSIFFETVQLQAAESWICGRGPGVSGGNGEIMKVFIKVGDYTEKETLRGKRVTAWSSMFANGHFFQRGEDQHVQTQLHIITEALPALMWFTSTESCLICRRQRLLVCFWAQSLRFLKFINFCKDKFDHPKQHLHITGFIQTMVRHSENLDSNSTNIFFCSSTYIDDTFGEVMAQWRLQEANCLCDSSFPQQRWRVRR